MPAGQQPRRGRSTTTSRTDAEPRRPGAPGPRRRPPAGGAWSGGSGRRGVDGVVEEVGARGGQAEDPEGGRRCARGPCRWKRTPAAAGATKTSRFLIHWRGRREPDQPAARADGVAGRRRGVFVGCVHSFGRSGHGVLGRSGRARGRRGERTTDPPRVGPEPGVRPDDTGAVRRADPRPVPSGPHGRSALSICLREAPVSSGGGQARPGRARPRGQGDRPGPPGRRLRGHLHRAPPDGRAGGPGGRPGGRRRGGPVAAVGGPPHPGPPGDRGPARSRAGTTCWCWSAASSPPPTSRC